MSKGEESAFPASVAVGAAGDVFTSYSTGLSRREYFAAMAMQGILANKMYEPPRKQRVAGMAEDAVLAADALLAALNTETEDEEA